MDLILVVAMCVGLMVFAAGVYNGINRATGDFKTGYFAIMFGIVMLSWAWIMQRNLVHPKNIEAEIGARQFLGTLAACSGFLLLIKAIILAPSMGYTALGIVLAVAGTAVTDIVNKIQQNSNAVPQTESDNSGDRSN